MIWHSLAVRERRLLIMGGAIIATILGSARVVPLWIRVHATVADSAADARQHVELAESLIRSRNVFHDSGVARARRYVGLANRVLRSGSASTGGAELAAMVSGAAEGAGLRLGPIQIQPDTAALGVFTKLAVRADLTGDIRGIADFLLAIERGPLMLNVREFSISQADVAGDNSRPESLRGEFVVEALLLSTNR